jgi:hypothetical protein
VRKRREREKAEAHINSHGLVFIILRGIKSCVSPLLTSHVSFRSTSLRVWFPMGVLRAYKVDLRIQIFFSSENCVNSITLFHQVSNLRECRGVGFGLLCV